MRELAVLDPRLARRYLVAVAAVAPIVEVRLSDRVVANRVARSSVDPPLIRLASWRVERRAFGVRLRRLSRASDRLVLADVRDCYGSIRPEVVAGSLRRLGCEPEGANDVRATLERIGEVGIPGLPVGPVASAVLANAVLSSVDDALERARVRYLRWVDDVVAVGAGSRAPDEVLALLASALRGLGLELNASKTRVLEPAELVRAGAVSIPRAGVGVG
jgi:hypothetical protein